MATSVAEVCETFRAQGRRVTPQRRAIARVLLGEERHLTADQILTRVRQELTTISPATVYNTLHELVEMGLLRELDLGLGLGERRYEIGTHDHDHMVCLRCGRIVDVPCHDGRELSAEESHGFEIVDRRVTYLGFCPACASDSEAG